MADPGEGPGGPAPPIFGRNRGPNGRKKIFLRPPPLFLPPPPPPPPPPPFFGRNRGPNGRKKNFLRPPPPPPPPPPPTYLKVWIRKWEALPESRQDFEVANFWTSQSCFLSSNLFSGCQYPLIDKPMLIIKPTVPSTRLLGMGRKLYPSNKQHIPNQN